MWQNAPLVSPTNTVNRDVATMGDYIDPVGESCADVEMGNEEESLETEIPTKNVKIVDMLFTGNGELLVSKLMVLGDNFKLNRKRKKKESEQPQW